MDELWAEAAVLVSSVDSASAVEASRRARVIVGREANIGWCIVLSPGGCRSGRTRPGPDRRSCLPASRCRAGSIGGGDAGLKGRSPERHLLACCRTRCIRADFAAAHIAA